jgi:hypothetical protein
MELGDSLQFTVWERKRKNGGEEFNTEFAEDAQRSQRRVKRRGAEAMDRKSPPFAEVRKGWGTLKFMCWRA